MDFDYKTFYLIGCCMFGFMVFNNLLNIYNFYDNYTLANWITSILSITFYSYLSRMFYVMRKNLPSKQDDETAKNLVKRLEEIKK